MADALTIAGSLTTIPSYGSPSGVPSMETPIAIKMQLSQTQTSKYVLLSDVPQVVAFGGVASANVLMVSTLYGHVVVTVTSNDGASQSFPADPMALIVSRSVPFTAVSITRDTGVDTTVEVFLGQKA